MVKCHARYVTRSAEPGVEKETKKQRPYTWNGNIPATRPSAFSRTHTGFRHDGKTNPIAASFFSSTLYVSTVDCGHFRIEYSTLGMTSKSTWRDDESIVDDMEDAIRSQSIGIYMIITGPCLLLLLLSDALANVLACQSNHKQKENSAQIDLCGKKMAASDLIVDRSSIKWSIPAMSVVFDGRYRVNLAKEYKNQIVHTGDCGTAEEFSSGGRKKNWNDREKVYTRGGI